MFSSSKESHKDLLSIANIQGDNLNEYLPGKVQYF
jgi:hypothetical protein